MSRVRVRPKVYIITPTLTKSEEPKLKGLYLPINRPTHPPPPPNHHHYHTTTTTFINTITHTCHRSSSILSLSSLLPQLYSSKRNVKQPPTSNLVNERLLSQIKTTLKILMSLTHQPNSSVTPHHLFHYTLNPHQNRSSIWNFVSGGLAFF